MDHKSQLIVHNHSASHPPQPTIVGTTFTSQPPPSPQLNIHNDLKQISNSKHVKATYESFPSEHRQLQRHQQHLLTAKHRYVPLPPNLDLTISKHPSTISSISNSPQSPPYTT